MSTTDIQQTVTLVKSNNTEAFSQNKELQISSNTDLTILKQKSYITQEKSSPKKEFENSRSSDSGKSSSCSPVLLDCSFDSGIAGVILDTDNMQLHKRIQQCQCILLALERDREYFYTIRNRLSKITHRKKKESNDNDFFCNVCCAEIDPEDEKTFVKCYICHKYICRSIKCADWLPKSAQWECELCQSSKESLAQTSSWVADQITFHKEKLIYPPRARSEIYIPISECNDSSIHFESVSQIGANSTTITAEQKLKIREYVEEVVAKLLGGNLDTIAVNQLSKSENYLPDRKLDNSDNGILSRESVSIKANGHNLTDISETRLRQMIQKIIAETINLPPLSNGHAVSEISLDRRSKAADNRPLSNGYQRHRTEHYFEPTIYQDLLATAVINKIVDKQLNNNHEVSETDIVEDSGGDVDDINDNIRLSEKDQNFNIEKSSTTSGSSVEPRSDCSYPEIEQILNTNDDKSSELLRNSDRDSVMSDYLASHLIPLPDLNAMATESDEEDYMSVTSSAIGDGTWEKNWLFKKKRTTLSSSVTANSVGIVVPDPKEDVRAQIGDKTADEVSDLSELGSDTDDSLDSLRSKLEPINDRLINKHLIGGQNNKMILDELIERSSMISNTLPSGQEPPYTDACNEHVIDAPTKNEAINDNVTQQTSAMEQKVSHALQDQNSNTLAASDDSTESIGCIGFSAIEIIDPIPDTPSVVEILAAMTLGPMLAVPSVDQPTTLTVSDYNAFTDLKELALAEIKARSLELTPRNLDVIPEETSDITNETENVIDNEEFTETTIETNLNTTETSFVPSEPTTLKMQNLEILISSPNELKEGLGDIKDFEVKVELRDVNTSLLGNDENDIETNSSKLESTKSNNQEIVLKDEQASIQSPNETNFEMHINDNDNTETNLTQQKNKVILNNTSSEFQDNSTNEDNQTVKNKINFIEQYCEVQNTDLEKLDSEPSLNCANIENESSCLQNNLKFNIETDISEKQCSEVIVDNNLKSYENADLSAPVKFEIEEEKVIVEIVLKEHPFETQTDVISDSKENDYLQTSTILLEKEYSSEMQLENTTNNETLTVEIVADEHLTDVDEIISNDQHIEIEMRTTLDSTETDQKSQDNCLSSEKIFKKEQINTQSNYISSNSSQPCVDKGTEEEHSIVVEENLSKENPSEIQLKDTTNTTNNETLTEDHINQSIEILSENNSKFIKNYELSTSEEQFSQSKIEKKDIIDEIILKDSPCEMQAEDILDHKNIIDNTVNIDNSKEIKTLADISNQQLTEVSEKVCSEDHSATEFKDTNEPTEINNLQNCCKNIEVDTSDQQTLLITENIPKQQPPENQLKADAKDNETSTVENVTVVHKTISEDQHIEVQIDNTLDCTKTDVTISSKEYKESQDNFHNDKISKTEQIDRQLSTISESTLDENSKAIETQQEDISITLNNEMSAVKNEPNQHLTIVDKIIAIEENIEQTKQTLLQDDTKSISTSSELIDEKNVTGEIILKQASSELQTEDTLNKPIHVDISMNFKLEENKSTSIDVIYSEISSEKKLNVISELAENYTLSNSPEHSEGNISQQQTTTAFENTTIDNSSETQLEDNINTTSNEVENILDEHLNVVEEICFKEQNIEITPDESVTPEGSLNLKSQDNTLVNEEISKEEHTKAQLENPLESYCIAEEKHSEHQKEDSTISSNNENSFAKNVSNKSITHVKETEFKETDCTNNKLEILKETIEPNPDNNIPVSNENSDLPQKDSTLDDEKISKEEHMETQLKNPLESSLSSCIASSTENDILDKHQNFVNEKMAEEQVSETQSEDSTNNINKEASIVENVLDKNFTVVKETDSKESESTNKLEILNGAIEPNTECNIPKNEEISNENSDMKLKNSLESTCLQSNSEDLILNDHQIIVHEDIPKEQQKSQITDNSINVSSDNISKKQHSETQTDENSNSLKKYHSKESKIDIKIPVKLFKFADEEMAKDNESNCKMHHSETQTDENEMEFDESSRESETEKSLVEESELANDKLINKDDNSVETLAVPNLADEKNIDIQPSEIKFQVESTENKTTMLNTQPEPRELQYNMESKPEENTSTEQSNLANEEISEVKQSSEKFEKVSSEKLEEVSSEKLEEVSSEKLEEVSSEKLEDVSPKNFEGVSSENTEKFSSEKLGEISSEKPEKDSLEKLEDVSSEKLNYNSDSTKIEDIIIELPSVIKQENSDTLNEAQSNIEICSNDCSPANNYDTAENHSKNTEIEVQQLDKDVDSISETTKRVKIQANNQDSMNNKTNEDIKDLEPDDRLTGELGHLIISVEECSLESEIKMDSSDFDQISKEQPSEIQVETILEPTNKISDIVELQTESILCKEPVIVHDVNSEQSSETMINVSVSDNVRNYQKNDGDVPSINIVEVNSDTIGEDQSGADEAICKEQHSEIMDDSLKILDSQDFTPSELSTKLQEDILNSPNIEKFKPAEIHSSEKTTDNEDNTSEITKEVNEIKELYEIQFTETEDSKCSEGAKLGVQSITVNVEHIIDESQLVDPLNSTEQTKLEGDNPPNTCNKIISEDGISKSENNNNNLEFSEEVIEQSLEQSEIIANEVETGNVEVKSGKVSDSIQNSEIQLENISTISDEPIPQEPNEILTEIKTKDSADCQDVKDSTKNLDENVESAVEGNKIIGSPRVIKSLTSNINVGNNLIENETGTEEQSNTFNETIDQETAVIQNNDNDENSEEHHEPTQDVTNNDKNILILEPDQQLKIDETTAVEKSMQNEESSVYQKGCDESISDDITLNSVQLKSVDTSLTEPHVESVKDISENLTKVLDNVTEEATLESLKSEDLVTSKNEEVTGNEQNGKVQNLESQTEDVSSSIIRETLAVSLESSVQNKTDEINENIISTEEPMEVSLVCTQNITGSKIDANFESNTTEVQRDGTFDPTTEENSSDNTNSKGVVDEKTSENIDTTNLSEPSTQCVNDTYSKDTFDSMNEEQYEAGAMENIKTNISTIINETMPKINPSELQPQNSTTNEQLTTEITLESINKDQTVVEESIPNDKSEMQKECISDSINEDTSTCLGIKDQIESLRKSNFTEILDSNAENTSVETTQEGQSTNETNDQSADVHYEHIEEIVTEKSSEDSTFNELSKLTDDVKVISKENSSLKINSTKCTTELPITAKEEIKPNEECELVETVNKDSISTNSQDSESLRIFKSDEINYIELSTTHESCTDSILESSSKSSSEQIQANEEIHEGKSPFITDSLVDTNQDIISTEGTCEKDNSSNKQIQSNGAVHEEQSSLIIDSVVETNQEINSTEDVFETPNTKISKGISENILAIAVEIATDESLPNEQCKLIDKTINDTSSDSLLENTTIANVSNESSKDCNETNNTKQLFSGEHESVVTICKEKSSERLETVEYSTEKLTDMEHSPMQIEINELIPAKEISNEMDIVPDDQVSKDTTQGKTSSNLKSTIETFSLPNESKSLDKSSEIQIEISEPVTKEEPSETQETYEINASEQISAINENISEEKSTTIKFTQREISDTSENTNSIAQPTEMQLERKDIINKDTSADSLVEPSTEESAQNKHSTDFVETNSEKQTNEVLLAEQDVSLQEQSTEIQIAPNEMQLEKEEIYHNEINITEPISATNENISEEKSSEISEIFVESTTKVFSQKELPNKFDDTKSLAQPYEMQQVTEEINETESISGTNENISEEKLSKLSEPILKSTTEVCSQKELSDTFDGTKFIAQPTEMQIETKETNATQSISVTNENISEEKSCEISEPIEEYTIIECTQKEHMNTSDDTNSTTQPTEMQLITEEINATESISATNENISEEKSSEVSETILESTTEVSSQKELSDTSDDSNSIAQPTEMQIETEETNATQSISAANENILEEKSCEISKPIEEYTIIERTQKELMDRSDDTNSTTQPTEMQLNTEEINATESISATNENISEEKSLESTTEVSSQKELSDTSDDSKSIAQPTEMQLDMELKINKDSSSPDSPAEPSTEESTQDKHLIDSNVSNIKEEINEELLVEQEISLHEQSNKIQIAPNEMQLEADENISEEKSSEISEPFVESATKESSQKELSDTSNDTKSIVSEEKSSEISEPIVEYTTKECPEKEIKSKDTHFIAQPTEIKLETEEIINKDSSADYLAEPSREESAQNKHVTDFNEINSEKQTYIELLAEQEHSEECIRTRESTTSEMVSETQIEINDIVSKEESTISSADKINFNESQLDLKEGILKDKNSDSIVEIINKESKPDITYAKSDELNVKELSSEKQVVSNEIIPEEKSTEISENSNKTLINESIIEKTCGVQPSEIIFEPSTTILEEKLSGTSDIIVDSTLPESLPQETSEVSDQVILTETPFELNDNTSKDIISELTDSNQEPINKEILPIIPTPQDEIQNDRNNTIVEDNIDAYSITTSEIQNSQKIIMESTTQESKSNESYEEKQPMETQLEPIEIIPKEKTMVLLEHIPKLITTDNLLNVTTLAPEEEKSVDQNCEIQLEQNENHLIETTSIVTTDNLPNVQSTITSDEIVSELKKEPIKEEKLECTENTMECSLNKLSIPKAERNSQKETSEAVSVKLLSETAVVKCEISAAINETTSINNIFESKETSPKVSVSTDILEATVSETSIVYQSTEPNKATISTQSFEIKNPEVNSQEKTDPVIKSTSEENVTSATAIGEIKEQNSLTTESICKENTSEMPENTSESITSKIISKEGNFIEQTSATQFDFNDNFTKERTDTLTEIKDSKLLDTAKENEHLITPNESKHIENIPNEILLLETTNKEIMPNERSTTSDEITSDTQNKDEEVKSEPCPDISDPANHETLKVFTNSCGQSKEVTSEDKSAKQIFEQNLKPTESPFSQTTAELKITNVITTDQTPVSTETNLEEQTTAAKSKINETSIKIQSSEISNEEGLSESTGSDSISERSDSKVQHKSNESTSIEQLDTFDKSISKDQTFESTDSSEVEHNEISSEVNKLIEPATTKVNVTSGKPNISKKLIRQNRVEDTTPSFEDVSPQIMPQTTPPSSISTNTLAALCQKYINDKTLLTALENRRRRTLLMHRFLSTLDISAGDSMEEPKNIHTEVLNTENPVVYESFNHSHDHESDRDDLSDTFIVQINDRNQVSYNFINTVLFSDQLSYDSKTNDESLSNTVEEFINDDEDENDDEKDNLANNLIKTTFNKNTTTNATNSTINNNVINSTTNNSSTAINSMENNTNPNNNYNHKQPLTNIRGYSPTCSSIQKYPNYNNQVTSAVQNNESTHSINNYNAQQSARRLRKSRQNNDQPIINIDHVNVEIVINENGSDHIDRNQGVDGDNKDEDEEDDDVALIRHFVPGSIAEREYKKWYNAVEMPNNPYAPEALKRRISGSQERFIDLPNISPSKDTNPLDLLDADENKTRESDYKRYSRDYYINSSLTTSPQMSPAKEVSANDTKDNREPTKKQSPTTENEAGPDLYKAIPAQVDDSGNSCYMDCMSQSLTTELDTNVTTTSESDTIKMNNIIGKGEDKDKTNEKMEQSTTIENSHVKERPTSLAFSKSESCGNDLITPTRGSTPTAFKFLQPKRKLLEPNQVLSVDEDEQQTATSPSDKPVIEADVAKALPSVKALARAFLMTTNITQPEKLWLRKARTLSQSGKKPPPSPKRSLDIPMRSTQPPKAEDDITITSDLSSLETDSSSVGIELSSTPDFAASNESSNAVATTGNASPVPVREGVLKNNIAFFENLKNK